MQPSSVEPRKRTENTLLVIAGILIVLMLLISLTPTLIQIYTTFSHNAPTTPSNNPTAVSAEAQAAATKADQEATQTQTILNVINFIAVAFTAVLAITGVIGFRGYRELESEGRKRLEELDKKRADVEQLQAEVQDRLKAIGDLQQFAQLQRSVTKSIGDTNKALFFLILGNQLLDRGKVKQAIEAYVRVKTLRPQDPLVNYILGKTYRDIGSYGQAIDCLEISVANDEGLPQAHYELGLAYRNRADTLYKNDQELHDDEYEKAIEQLKTAAKQLPEDVDVLGSIGGTYRRAHDYKNSLKYYKRALEVDPESIYALNNVALLNWHEGHLPEARDAFKRVAEVANKRLATGVYEPYWDYYDRALARLVLGQKEQAMQDYQKAISLTPGPDQFTSVMDGLKFLQEVESTHRIDGLDQVIALLEDAIANKNAAVLVRAS